MSRRAVPHKSANDQGHLTPTVDTVVAYRLGFARLIDVEADRVLVAVSGGADSLALLLLTHAAIGDRCHAATVDHGLRARSGEEATFVASLCADRGIAHTILIGDLPPRVGRTANVSARARALRYGLLEARARALGNAWLATAHHADDQVETMIMRLNRGAGVAGLAGIRARGGRIVRPLLGWRRETLAAIVRECGIAAVDDPSNIDDRFDRARLRKVLSGIDWLDADRIVTSAGALGDAEDALRWMTDSLWPTQATLGDDAVVLDVAGLPREMVRRLVVRAVESIDPGRSPAGPGIDRLMRVLDSGRPGMVGNVVATRAAGDSANPRWRFRLAPPRRTR